jgi:hypothetical protein
LATSAPSCRAALVQVLMSGTRNFPLLARAAPLAPTASEPAAARGVVGGDASVAQSSLDALQAAPIAGAPRAGGAPSASLLPSYISATGTTAASAAAPGDMYSAAHPDTLRGNAGARVVPACRRIVRAVAVWRLLAQQWISRHVSLERALAGIILWDVVGRSSSYFPPSPPPYVLMLSVRIHLAARGFVRESCALPLPPSSLLRHALIPATRRQPDAGCGEIRFSRHWR